MLFPGYSYDMAYVEFLNLEDAVHFMESNQVAHPRPSTTALSANRKKAWAWGGGGGGGWALVGNGVDGTWDLQGDLFPTYINHDQLKHAT